MLAPRADWSVLEIGRNREAEERSVAKRRCRRRRVDGAREVVVGLQYSEERKMPKNAEEKVAQNMSASRGG